MHLSEQLKVFLQVQYELLSNLVFPSDMKMNLVIDFWRYSLKTFLLRYIGLKFKNETLLGYSFIVDYYPDFVSQFIEIFVHNIYYFPLKEKNPTIVECGSNIGVSTLFFRIMYPKATIVSYEADPDTFAILSENVKRNKLKKIELINAAVFTKKGKLTFHMTLDTDEKQTRSVANSLYANSKNYKEIVVKSEDIAKVIRKPISILQMDVEGVESQLLEHLGKKLSFVKHIALEFHVYENLKDTNRLSKLLGVLEEQEFSYFVNEADGQVGHSMQNHLLIVRATRNN